MPATTLALTQPAALAAPRARPIPTAPSRHGPSFADALADSRAHVVRPTSENHAPAREDADLAPVDAQEPAADAQPAPDSEKAPKDTTSGAESAGKDDSADASTADLTPSDSDHPNVDAAQVAVGVAENAVAPTVEQQPQREGAAQGGAPKPTQKDSAPGAPTTADPQPNVAPAHAPAVEQAGAQGEATPTAINNTTADAPADVPAAEQADAHVEATPTAITNATADAPAEAPAAAPADAPPTAAAEQTVTTTQKASSDTKTKKDRVEPHAHALHGSDVADPKAEPPAGRVVAVDSVLASPDAGARPQGQRSLVQALAGADGAGSAPLDGQGSVTESGAFRAQVSRGIEAALRHDGGSVTLRLKPDALGALRIDLHIHMGEVAARFQASTHEAHELLTSHLSSLRASLEAKGLGVRQIDVQPPSDAKGGDAPRDFGQNNAGSHGFSPGAGGQTSSRREDPGGNAYASTPIEPLAEAEPIEPGWRRVVAAGSLDAVA